MVLSRLPTDGKTDLMESAKAAAECAATQQPRVMRSASLSYVLQSIKEMWKLGAKIGKPISEDKKSATARYLQLKSGHAVTGEHLGKTRQARDARCW